MPPPPLKWLCRCKRYFVDYFRLLVSILFFYLTLDWNYWKYLIGVKPILLCQVLRWETTSVLGSLTSICPNLPLPYCFCLYMEHSLVCSISFLYTRTHIT